MADRLAASVVLNTFNRAERLALCLPAYLKQTRTDFELIVADDASTDHTDQVVGDFARRAPFPVRHVRHDVEGHHRTMALNLGIRAARSTFVLFGDSDCLPPRNWVEVHCNHREEKRLLIGGRIMLTEEETRGVDAEMVETSGFESFLDAKRRSQLRRIHWRNRLYIALRKRRRPHNYALNMSAERWALLAVNGFDEHCEGWGDVDGELRERLKRIGVWPKCITDRSVVFHLWHPRHPTMGDRPNREYVRRPDIPIWCEKGVFKLSEDPVAPEAQDAPSRSQSGTSQ